MYSTATFRKTGNLLSACFISFPICSCPSAAKGLPCFTHRSTPRTANCMKMEMPDHRRLILQSPSATSLFVTQENFYKEKAHFTNKLCLIFSPGQNRYLGKSYGSFSSLRRLQRALNRMRTSSSIPIYTEIRYKTLSSFKLHSYLKALGTKYSALLLISTATYVPEVIQKKQGEGLGPRCCQLANTSRSRVEIQISFKFREGITPERGVT